MCVNKISHSTHTHIVCTHSVEHRQNIQMISSTHVKNEPHDIKHELKKTGEKTKPKTPEEAEME